MQVESQAEQTITKHLKNGFQRADAESLNCFWDMLKERGQ